MKHLFIAVLLISSIQLYALEKLIVPMWKLHVFEDVSAGSIIQTQDLGQDPTEPFVVKGGEWYIPSYGIMRIYNPDFSLKRIDNCNTMAYLYEKGGMLRTSIVGNAFRNCINLIYINGRYINKDIVFENELGIYFGVYENIILYTEQNSDPYRFIGYEIHGDGSYRVCSQEELASSQFSYKDDFLYFNGVRASGCDVIDDDGNLYSHTMLKSEGVYIDICSDIGMTDGGVLGFAENMIDDEGNYWEIRYTEDPSFKKPVQDVMDGDRPGGVLSDPKSHPVAWYSGRTWGYRDPPKEAVVIDDGLRLRLRANTSAFVLGTLKKNQKITILKTGEKATIGGVTAPWYRVKTEDGLVGWAFGGFIKVIEN